MASAGPAVFGGAGLPGPDGVTHIPALRHRALVTLVDKGGMRMIAREHSFMFRRSLATRDCGALNQRNPNEP